MQTSSREPGDLHASCLDTIYLLDKKRTLKTSVSKILACKRQILLRLDSFNFCHTRSPFFNSISTCDFVKKITEINRYFLQCSTFISHTDLMTKMLSRNKNFFFSDFSCTQGHMCVYGCYAPATLTATTTTAIKRKGEIFFATFFFSIF